MSWKKVKVFWNFRLLKANETGMFLHFVLLGDLLFVLLLLSLVSNIFYSETVRIGFGLLNDRTIACLPVALMGGLLVPLVCFPLKCISWRLAWGVLISVFLAFGTWVWWWRSPEHIFRQTFGQYADGMYLKSLEVDNSAKGYRAFCIEGEVDSFLDAVKKTFPDGESANLYYYLRGLPDFMTPGKIPEKASGWLYYRYIWMWKSESGELYIKLRDWDLSPETEKKWNDMIRLQYSSR